MLEVGIVLRVTVFYFVDSIFGEEQLMKLLRGRILSESGTVLFLAVLGLFLAMGIPFSYALPDSDPPDKDVPDLAEGKKVSNLFFQTSLTDALADLSAQTGVTIVSDPSVQGLVTCELKDASLEEALDILLAGGGYVYRHMGGFVLVGTPDPENPTFSSLSVTRSLKLNYLSPQTAKNLLPTALARFVKSTEDSRVLTIMAPEAVADQIEKEVIALDTAPQQVMLDARIVIMETGRLSELGLQWNWPQLQAGAYTSSANYNNSPPGAPNIPWGIQFGYTPSEEYSNALILALNLLATNDEANVMANPQLMVQDGEEAEINVGTEEYFEILTTGYYTSSELEKIEAGIVLNIRPRVTDSGEIVLEMQTEVSDVVARGQDNLPVVTRRKASSSVRVDNGGTAAVAGLNDRRYRHGMEKVPFLWRLPLLGHLFQNESEASSEGQVLVFVTAHIMDGEDGVARKEKGEPEVVQPVSPEFEEELRQALISLGVLSKSEEIDQ